MTDHSVVEGELLAFRCHLAALLDVLPQAFAVPYRAALEHRASLVRHLLDETGQAAFDRERIALAVMRLTATPDRGAVRGG